MAIAGMNGQWLGGRSLRTNWATGKGGGSTQRTQTSEVTINHVFTCSMYWALVSCRTVS